MSKSQPTCIELFAGSGGLMLGLERAGFHTLLANEIHPHPCMTLRHNFPNRPVIEGSIKDFTGSSLLKAAGYSDDLIGKITLIAGGPPCQGFSNAGLKNKADPRNTLIGDFLRIVKDLQPEYFLLENVTGLLTLHDGELFENVLNEIRATGYQFSYKVLCAADYGVPQMRRRLIVLGSRDGFPPPHPEPTHRAPNDENLFSAFLPKYVTCKEALADLPEVKSGETATRYTKKPKTSYQQLMREKAAKVHNHEASKHRAETAAYYALVPPGGNAMHIPDHLRKKKVGMQRWPLNGISRTITTEPTDFLHPTLHRIPTVREMARIQSYPDHYVFLGQRTTGNKMRRLGYCSQTQQVGNSVPPLLAEAIGKSILRHAGYMPEESMQRKESSLPFQAEMVLASA